MRHNIKKVKLGNNAAYTRSVLKNLATSLVEHGKIETTEKKAKAVKNYLDKIIGKVVKQDNKNTARTCNEVFFTKNAKKKLMEIKDKCGKNGSNIRITKLRKRLGDNATIVQVEIIS